MKIINTSRFSLVERGRRGRFVIRVLKMLIFYLTKELGSLV